MPPLDHAPFFDLEPDILPTHPTRTWPVRDLAGVRGLVVHHVGGPIQSFASLARYHIGPNHISKDGLPGLAYHFAVDRHGRIYKGASLHEAPYSQTYPVPYAGTHPHRSYVSVVVEGDWTSADTAPDGAEVGAVRHAIVCINEYLDEAIASGVPLLFHSDFNKASCPGKYLEQVLRGVR